MSEDESNRPDRKKSEPASGRGSTTSNTKTSDIMPNEQHSKRTGLEPQRSSSGDSLIAGPSAAEQPTKRRPGPGPDDSDDKWQCRACTYLNYMSAIRCTICRADRPTFNRRIEDSAAITTSSTEAHANKQTSWTNKPGNTICQQSRPNPNTIGGGGGGGGASTTADDTTSGGAKWSCARCTYLNWPRSQRCVQCRRPNTPMGAQATDVQQQAAPLHVLIHNTRNQDCGQVSDERGTSMPPKDHQSGRSSRQMSPLLQAGPSSSSEWSQLDQRAIASKLQKWACRVCTYENWPKAPKCVMCYTPRANDAATHEAVSRRVSRGSGPNSGQRSPEAEPAAAASPNTGKRMYKDNSAQEPVDRKSPKSSSPPSVDSSHENLASAAAAAVNQRNASSALEQHLRRLRNKPGHHIDFLWLTAVRSLAVSTCDSDPVEAYLSAGGDPTRPLTQHEAMLMSTVLPDHGFEMGQTLVHLAVRCQREDLVTLLLSAPNTNNRAGSTAMASSSSPSSQHIESVGAGGGNGSSGSRRTSGLKRVPCHASPDTAAAIKHHIAQSLRQRKCEMPCYYFTDLTTFTLPAKILDLSPPIQRVLFDELLDKNVQKELEEECAIINWSLEICDRLGSRLYALWNRTAGDCLLDSVLQATWGVFDSENSLRQALHDSLSQADHLLVFELVLLEANKKVLGWTCFYPRWREYELLLSKAMQFSLDESQLARDWQLILRLASKPGSALEQVHVFALAHVIRRPIIVYGVRVVKSMDGDHLDYARFEGVYLPLLWEPSFCVRSPICLGYTRGHFVALVPMQPSRQNRAATLGSCAPRYAYLPLQDADAKLLPVHFLSQNEYGHEGLMMRTWLDATVTDGGLWCCKMKLHKQPPLTEQMLEEWLDYYRRLDAQQHHSPAQHIISIPVSAQRLRSTLQDPQPLVVSNSSHSGSSSTASGGGAQSAGAAAAAAAASRPPSSSPTNTTGELLDETSGCGADCPPVLGYDADNSSSSSGEEEEDEQ